MERIENGTVLNIIGYDARLLLLSLLLATSVPSCGPCKNIPIVQKDSTVINYIDSLRIIDKVVVRDSIVLLPTPIEGSQNIMPTFLPSHLETSLAESDAYMDSLGLHHSLKNKEKSLSVTVPVTEHYVEKDHSSQKDSLSAHIETKYVEVEKPLSKWQKFRIGAFWWLVLALASSLVYIFRKPIIKFIKSIIV